MAEIIDSPLVRIVKEYETKLKEKQAEIDDLKLKMNTVRGVNELLKLEVRNLETTIAALNKSVLQATDHVKRLKDNLPEDLEKG